MSAQEACILDRFFALTMTHYCNHCSYFAQADALLFLDLIS